MRTDIWFAVAIWLLAAPGWTSTSHAQARSAIPEDGAAPVQAASADRSSPPVVLTLDLQAALRLALQNTLELTAAEYEIEARQGALRQAAVGSAMSVFAEVEEISSRGGRQAIETSVGLSREIRLGDKREKGRHAARLDVEAAGLLKAAQQVDVFRTVQERYLDVLLQQKAIASQEKRLALHLAVRTALEQQVAVGDLLPSGLSQCLLDGAVIRQGLAQMRREHRLACNRLAETWGQFPASFALVADDVPDEVPATSEEQLQSLEQTPAWALLDLQVKQAEAEVQVVISQAKPDIDLEGGVKFSREDDDLSFFVGLSMPVATGRRQRGAQIEAEARLAKARSEQLAGQRRLRLELHAAREQLRNAEESLAEVEIEVLPEAERVLTIVSAALTKGEAVIHDLYNAQAVAMEQLQAHMVRQEAWHRARLALSALLLPSDLSALTASGQAMRNP